MDEKEQEQQLLSPAPKEEAQPSGAGAAQESGDAKESRQHRISHGQQKRRQRSVFQYIAILFAAAFVLLFITYRMDRRQYELMQEQNEGQISDLQQTISAFQSLQGLQEENAALKEKVSELEEQAAQQESQMDELQQNNTQLQDTLSKTSSALDWFWQIDEAYVRGRYSLCRQLITSLEEAGLVEYLPKESVTYNGRFSPYDRYQEIYEALY